MKLNQLRFVAKKKIFRTSLAVILSISLLSQTLNIPGIFLKVSAASENTISNSCFSVTVGQYGQISNLQIVGDLYPTNYVLSQSNAPEQDTADHEWMGELMFQVKSINASSWNQELTSKSDSGRTIEKIDQNTIKVTYQNAGAGGIQSFKLVETYQLVGKKLQWSMSITNTQSNAIVIGDFGMPLAFNEKWPGGEEIYETRTVMHSFVGEDSSYVYDTRPSGQGSFLLLTPDASTGAKFEYHDHWVASEHPNSTWTSDSNGGNWSNGLNVFYIHSDVIKSTGRGYLPNTSLTLQPGDTKTYTFNFTAASSQTDMKSQLYNAGLIDANVVPSMTVTTDTDVKLDLHTNADPSTVKIASIDGPDTNGLHTQKNDSNNHLPGSMSGTSITYSEKKVVDGETHLIYNAKFSYMGQNNVTITYGDGKKTVLQFYVMAPVSTALQQHSDFIVNSTQVNAPGQSTDKVFDDWMMATQSLRGEYNGYGGWGDDWSLTHGEYLAEQNVYTPKGNQITALDNYLNTAIWNGLMKNHHKDYLVSDWLNMDSTGRAFAYPHIYNTYFAMYQIADKYPEFKTIENKDTYLLRCYNIIHALYSGNVGYNFGTGLMGEQTTPDIIAALRKEGYITQADDVVALMSKKYDSFKPAKYPYGSEFAYDNTGEESVYTLAKMNNNTTQMGAIVKKTLACRGSQPIWYYYATPETLCGEAWWSGQYSTSLIGYCEDDWLRLQNNGLSNADKAILERQNYAAKLGNLAQINSGQIDGHAANIGASAWTYQPELGSDYHDYFGSGTLVNGWRQMTGESDLGIYGALRILSADVVTDPVFGLYGYGCQVADNGGSYTVTPKDGLYTRLNLIDQKIYMELQRDQYSSATISKDGSQVDLTLTNLTKTAHDTQVDFTGLKAGSYDIVEGGTTVGHLNNTTGKTSVTAAIPMTAAASTQVTLKLSGSTPDNQAPVVNAGADVTVLRSADIDLKGIVTDDGFPTDTLTYKWTLESAPVGGTVKMSGEDSIRLTGKASVAGDYVFKLTANDGSLSGSDTVKVTVQEDPPLPAVLAHYSFDKSSISGDTVTDSSDCKNNATIVGGRETATGKVGDALKLNGSSGYITLPASITNRITDSTISMYFKLNATPNSTQTLLSLDDGNVTLVLNKSSKLQFTITDGTDTQTITTDAIIPPGYWKNVTVTVSGNTVTLFVDGVKVGENNNVTVHIGDFGNACTNYIGKAQTGGTNFNGIVDEFSMTTSALTANEVAQKYTNTDPVNLVSLDPVSTTVHSYIAPTLPTTLRGLYSNGTYKDTTVTWDAIPEKFYNKPDKFTIQGSVTGSAIKATATVTVIAGPNPPNLVAKYNFDGSTATVSDLSGKGHDAIIVGTSPTSTLVSGKSGNGVLMSSANQNKVILGNSADFKPQNTTISFWVKRQTDIVGDNEAIFGWAKNAWNENGWYMNCRSDAPVGFYMDAARGFTVDGSKVNANAFFPKDEWVNVVVTWDQATQTGKVYRNGVEQTINYSDTDGGMSLTATDAETTLLHNYYGAVTTQFAMDDFSLYNTALSSDYITNGSPFAKYAPLAMQTIVNTAPSLPSTVMAIYSDNTDKMLPVTWDPIASDKYASVGTFTVSGKALGESTPVTCTVTVSDTAPKPATISSLEVTNVETVQGVAPILPNKIVAKYSDNSLDRLNVTWDPISPDKYAAAGTFTINGTVAGTDIKAVCNVTVTETKQIDPNANVAKAATATASYTNSDLGGIAALNDGYDPTSSGDKSHAVWHDWGQDGKNQWLQYTFKSAVKLDACNAYYFTDGGGIAMPGSVIYQYLDSNGQWQYMTNVSGEGTSANQYNTTTFDPITTTAIRMNLTPHATSGTGSGLGLIEWKVYTITHQVIFKDYDGAVLKVQKVNDGTAATAPDNLTRSGYVFTGWDKPYSAVTSDLTITAQYIATHQVTFKDYDGTVLKVQKVNDGTAATAPANPTRANYIFTGWDKTYSAVTGDLTITAQYKKNTARVVGTQDKNASSYSAKLTSQDVSDTQSVEVSLGNITINAPASVLLGILGADPSSHLGISQVPSSDAVKALVAEAGLKGNSIVCAINIDLMKYLSNGTSIPVHALGGKIMVTIALTKDQKAQITDPTNAKLYYYDPATKSLVDMSAKFDMTAGTVSFYTDHFSTYVISQLNVSKPDNGSTTNNGSKSNNIPNPKTSDSSTAPFVEFYLALAVSTLVGLYWLRKKKRKTSKV